MSSILSQPQTVIRYVPTYMNRAGMRTLMLPAQGRYTYTTGAEAQGWIDAIHQRNSKSRLEEIWNVNPRFEVRPCECWAGHFDPVGIYFDLESV